MPVHAPAGPPAHARPSRTTVARAAGASGLLRIAASRAWSSATSFGLEAGLSALPERRAARIPIEMEPCDPQRFAGFAQDIPLVTPDERVEVARRHRMCQAGVTGLHVAFDADRRPIYAQWLVAGEEGEPLHRFSKGLMPRLHTGEALVEGAYTFAAFRRLGAMGDGMHQLLSQAAADGATRCFTYVAPDNIPSLRGCAHVGFVLGHVRTDRRRVGRRVIARRAPSASERAQWLAATTPSR